MILLGADMKSWTRRSTGRVLQPRDPSPAAAPRAPGCTDTLQHPGAGQVSISLLSLPAAWCPPPRVPYGRVSPRRYSYRTWDTVSITCNPGYTLRGPGSSTCGAASRWDPPLPQCKKGEWHTSAGSGTDRGERASCVLPNSLGMQSRDGSVLAALPKLGWQRNRNSPGGTGWGGTRGWLCPRDGERLTPRDGRV